MVLFCACAPLRGQEAGLSVSAPAQQFVASPGLCPSRPPALLLGAGAVPLPTFPALNRSAGKAPPPCPARGAYTRAQLEPCTSHAPLPPSPVLPTAPPQEVAQSLAQLEDQRQRQQQQQVANALQVRAGIGGARSLLCVFVVLGHRVRGGGLLA